MEETMGYIREIPNTGWVSEAIAERFDNALEMMTPNSVIYGGAVRDVLSGKELLGDLDIVLPPEDFGKISNSFHTNSKWIPFDPNVPLNLR